MTDMPERIWIPDVQKSAFQPHGFNPSSWLPAPDWCFRHEYVRADLIRDAVLAEMRIATSTSIEMVPEAIQDAINEIMGGKND